MCWMAYIYVCVCVCVYINVNTIWSCYFFFIHSWIQFANILLKIFVCVCVCILSVKDRVKTSSQVEIFVPTQGLLRFRVPVYMRAINSHNLSEIAYHFFFYFSFTSLLKATSILPFGYQLNVGKLSYEMIHVGQALDLDSWPLLPWSHKTKAQVQIWTDTPRQKWPWDAEFPLTSLDSSCLKNMACPHYLFNSVPLR